MKFDEEKTKVAHLQKKPIVTKKPTVKAKQPITHNKTALFDGDEEDGENLFKKSPAKPTKPMLAPKPGSKPHLPPKPRKPGKTATEAPASPVVNKTEVDDLFAEVQKDNNTFNADDILTYIEDNEGKDDAVDLFS